MAIFHVVPYAFGVDENGLPDAEGKRRCLGALALVGKFPDVVIVLGAGMPEKLTGKPVQTLAGSASWFLQQQGLSILHMLLNPKGRSTARETAAAYEVIPPISRHSVVFGVTSWWHGPRVWLCGRIIFGRNFRVKGVGTTHHGMVLARDIVHEIVAMPKSFVEACILLRRLRRQPALPVAAR